MKPKAMPEMKIVRVTATPLNVPLHIGLMGADKNTSLAVCYVEVETDSGLIGHGFTAITEEDVVAQAVNGVIAPTIVGDDPLLHERIWEKLYWTMMPRGQSGYAAHALAAVDLALWDIKGKALNLPVWKLHRRRARAGAGLCHFRVRFFDRDQLARRRQEMGGGRLPAAEDDGRRARRSSTRTSAPVMDAIREDARRVQAVREAVGPEVEIFIDANCNLDLYHATKLVEMIGRSTSPFSKSRSRRTTSSAWRSFAAMPASPWPAARTRGCFIASAICWPRRRSIMRSPMSASPAASPNA